MPIYQKAGVWGIELPPPPKLGTFDIFRHGKYTVRPTRQAKYDRPGELEGCLPAEADQFSVYRDTRCTCPEPVWVADFSDVYEAKFYAEAKSIKEGR